MSILLSTLVSQLVALVPARNALPSSAQYEKCVKESVNDFSRRCSREKITTLSIIAGQATYQLPDDYVSLIGFYFPSVVNGVYVTNEGLVPSNNGMQNLYERRTISNYVLTITPTPAYSLTYYMRYGAGWAMSGSDVNRAYEDLSEEESEICLIKAQALALTLQLNSGDAGVLSYQIGDERFDKSGGVQAMIAQRDAMLKDYLDTCDSYNGALTIYGGGL